MSTLHKAIILLSAFCLSACNEAPEAPAEVKYEVEKPVTAPEAPTAPSAGGYVPNDSERVPGITLSQEELDKLYAEARANTPQPVIPPEAK